MNNNKDTNISSTGNVTDSDMELINKYARKQLSKEEVYTFTVVLCDNDVDRDYEHFTVDTLEKLTQLFVGVTGIYDHDTSAKNQIARIYDCKCEYVEGKKTQLGEEYMRVVAKAYIPVCEATKEIISLLDSGIRKEVSVGCGIGKCTCSICGADMREHSCTHIRGESYSGKLCCGVLSEPTDAYEWSFTAVPAQRKAGVIKSFLRRDDDEYDKMKRAAAQSERFKSYMILETVKAGVTAQIGIGSELLEKMVSSLGADDMIKLKSIFEEKSSQLFPVRSQLGTKSRDNDISVNSEYSI